jgi:hypothetical protein
VAVLVVIYALYLVIVLPLVAIGTCAVYAAGIPVTYLAALTRVLATRPAWLPDPKQWPQPPEDSDPAVLHYFFGVSRYGLYGPSVADVVHVARIAYDDCRANWGYRVNAALNSLTRRQPQFAALLRAAAAAGMGAGIIFGAFIAACCASIHILVVGLCGAGARIAAAVLNGAAAAFPRTQTCPGCSAQVRRPRYICNGHGCQREHRDLRPGRFGVLRRRCHCGTSIRTLPLSGSPPAAAVCPHCGHVLRKQGTGDAPEILLPFFGPTDEARSRQMLSMLEQLRAWDIDGQLAVVTDGPDAVGEPGSPPSGFPPPRHSHAVRLLTDDGARVLCMFDATDDLGNGSAHPGRVRTCVLVVDPASSPGTEYGKMLERIKAMGVDPRAARLAVVFTRGDLVNQPDRKVIRWARRQPGVGDLVRSVRRDFKDSRFFCADTGEHGHGASLLRWLLIADGVAPARSRVVVDVREEEESSYRWHRRYVFAAVLGVIVTALALIFTR